MQVGIGINQTLCQSAIDDGRGPKNGLSTSFVHPSQNAIGSSHDKEINIDGSVSNNLRNPSRGYQFNKSTSLGNLSFINVVGLPCHPRQQSVPSSVQPSTIYPIHSRNASEPNTTPGLTQHTVPSNITNVGTDVTLGTTLPKVSTCNQSCNTPDSREVWNRNPVVPRDQMHPRPTDGTTDFRQGTPSQKPELWSSRSTGTTCDNVSNVNVNFYRAVPMNVSAVPKIECLNNQTAKNVSNVQIMPLSGSIPDRNSGSTSGPCRTSVTSCRVTVQNDPPTQTETVSSVYVPIRIAQRTFTSTEAQTDNSLGFGDLGNNKERRRRDRRERRHNRRTNPVHSRPVDNSQNGNSSTLPDILDSHIPPPYTTHPNTLQRNHPNHQIRGLPHLGMMPQQVLLPPPQLLGGMVPPQPVVPNMMAHPRPRSALQNSVSNPGVPHVSYPPPNVISGPIVQNVPDNASGFRFALPVGQFSR